jgi:hypothetical protein
LLTGASVFAEPILSPTPFTIRIVDVLTGEGVAGLRVTSDNGIVCYTQQTGDVSWGEYSVVGRDVRFTIEDEAHRFSYLATTLPAVRGGRTTIAVTAR